MSIRIPVNAGVLALLSCLTGCATLDFSKMLQPDTVSSVTCKDAAGVGIVPIQLLALRPAVGAAPGVPAPKVFAFVLPAAAIATSENIHATTNLPADKVVGRSASGAFARALPNADVTDFEVYASRVSSARMLLPEAVRADPVVDAFMRSMIKASAQAQAMAGVAALIPGAEAQLTKISNYDVPGALSSSQVKAFANAMFTPQLRPTIVAPPSGASDTTTYTKAFAAYFAAYYDGKFVDRFGQTISKPSISLPDFSKPGSPIKNISISISDADIASALTVLIEFIADTIDPTPVLGDADPGSIVTSGDNATTFYPAGSTSEPTAIAINPPLANYIKVSTTCGVTADNAKILGYVANAAGDEAQLVDGLVTQSAGGIGVAAGAFGKISIGDNLLLATIVKTAASRAAMRITLASGYWALESAGGASSGPAPANPLHAALRVPTVSKPMVGAAAAAPLSTVPTGGEYLAFPK